MTGAVRISRRAFVAGLGATAGDFDMRAADKVLNRSVLNEAVVEHDHVGRLAVRLAVDKTLCVGESRAVRALHQGAVMEGSWGDEARLVATVDDAAATLDTDDWRPAPGRGDAA